MAEGYQLRRLEENRCYIWLLMDLRLLLYVNSFAEYTFAVLLYVCSSFVVKSYNTKYLFTKYLLPDNLFMKPVW